MTDIITRPPESVTITDTDSRRRRICLEWAQLYTETWGWFVFPIRRGAKTPATRNGFKDATREPTQLHVWFDRDDAPNIGVDCGRSELVVVDIDSRAGGYETLRGLTADGHLLPRTLTQLTGGGGVHYIYRPDPARPLRNTAGTLPGVGTTPGIDVRAAGGYIVLPPSTTAGPYEWMPPRWAKSPAPLPEWLKPEATRPRSNSARNAPSGGTRYGVAALERILGRLAAAPVGTRNDELNRQAFAVGQLAAGGQLAADPSLAQLQEVAKRVGLDDLEVALTTASGYANGCQKPLRP